MHTAVRCIALFFLFLAGLAGSAQQAKTDTFILHFPFDRSGIRPADTAAFRLFVSDRLRTKGEISSNGDIDSISITGHTDTVGNPAYNQQLSRRRAFAAMTLFRQWLGPDSSLITRIEAHGETEPLPGDDSGSRRVTIVYWHRPSPPTPLPALVAADSNPPAAEPDTVFELEDIRFYANTTVLTDAAQMSLPKYTSYLLTFRERFLEIDGYCNSPGAPLPTNDPLYILSVKRAKFIYDHLIEKGFDPDRLLYKGKGNTNPRNAHPTTRGEADQNMRVEIRVFRKKPVP
ncbi:OmpA family protein [Puia sp.]|uniref:OmpA family protein n=1 Tax=Puia sp. TaxID=2045100 RepID=UPI002F4175DB